MKRRLHPFAILGLTVLGLALAGVAWYKFDEFRSASAIESELSQLRAMGVPTTVAEYAASTPQPATDNAAPLYVKAMDELKSVDMPRQRTQEYVDATQGAYDLFWQAAQLESGVFERDWTQRPTWAFPEVRELGGLVGVSIIRADLARESRDWATMFEELTVVNQASSNIQEPHVATLLSQLYFRRRALFRLKRALNEHSDDRELIWRAKAWLARPVPDFDYQAAFHSWVVRVPERVATLKMEAPPAGLTARDRVDRRLLDTPATKKAIHATALREFRAVLEGSPSDPFEVAKRLFAAEERLTGDRSLVNRGALEVTSISRRLGRALVAPTTERRLLHVALWIAERRLETGQFPTALPSEAKFIDPWTKKPYLIIKPEKGIIIRSVGSNGLDDGGPHPPSGRTDDLEVSLGVPLTP